MKIVTLSVEQARQADERAQKEFGIPSLILMENAARSLAESIQKLLIAPLEKCVVVFVCGTGNNGGDGLAAARHLYQKGIVSEIFLAGSEANFTADTSINYRIIQKFGITICPFSEFSTRKNSWDRRPVVLIDALLGTGFKPPIRPEMKEVVHQLNEFKRFHTSAVKIISVDIPSGLDGDNGPTEGTESVKADVTLTLACLKQGLTSTASRPYVGRIEVLDIGIPEKLLKKEMSI